MLASMGDELARGGANTVAWLVMGMVLGMIACHILAARVIGFTGYIVLGVLGAFVGGTLGDLFFPASARLGGSLATALLGTLTVLGLGISLTVRYTAWLTAETTRFAAADEERELAPSQPLVGYRNGAQHDAA